MAIKLTVESFLAGVRQSGLIDDADFEAFLSELERAGGGPASSEAVAAMMVNQGLLTSWQSAKLLEGRFRGFLLGRYRLLELLGRGEMSAIYLAEHSKMKRRCAVKVLSASKVQDTSYLGRFHREAMAVASLDHPNIVRAYDVDQSNEAGSEIHFLVMEYVDGLNLEKLLEQRQQFTIVEAAEYLRQAAEGLAHAHRAGLIHRDIKPGNLLVDKHGTVKLLDLGLARFFKESDVESLTIKHDEKVLGTADYLAPEQAVDSHSVDERADIYSLGCTFYFALTGTPPFTEGTLVQRLLAHQTKNPPPIENLRPDTPAPLAEILRKMMEKRKEDRYQTAAEVADALARFLTRHGGADWRRSHPEIVARYRDFESLARRAAHRDHVKADEHPLAPPPGESAAAVPSRVSHDDVVKGGAAVRAVTGPSPADPARSPLHSESLRRVSMPDSPRLPALLEPVTSAGRSRNPSVDLWTRSERFLRQNSQFITLALIILTAAALIAGIGASLQAYTEAEAVRSGGAQTLR